MWRSKLRHLSDYYTTHQNTRFLLCMHLVVSKVMIAGQAICHVYYICAMCLQARHTLLTCNSCLNMPAISIPQHCYNYYYNTRNSSKPHRRSWKANHTSCLYRRDKGRRCHAAYSYMQALGHVDTQAANIAGNCTCHLPIQTHATTGKLASNRQLQKGHII